MELVDKIIFSKEAFTDCVDFSYPGRADISLHMKYQDVIDILEQRYPKLVRTSELEYRVKFKPEKIDQTSTKRLIIGPDGFVCSDDAKSEDFDERYFRR